MKRSRAKSNGIEEMKNCKSDQGQSTSDPDCDKKIQKIRKLNGEFSFNVFISLQFNF